MKVAVNVIICNKTNTLNFTEDEASIKEIKLNYTLTLPETAAEEEVDMSTGFFDTVVSNCSLSLWTITKVQKKDGTYIDKSEWEKYIVYDHSVQKLTIKDYFETELTDFEETKLYFQSQLPANNTNMSHPYHMVTLKMTILDAPTQVTPEPKFIEELAFLIIDDFQNIK